MVSTGDVLAGFVRVVVFTPLLLVLMAATMRTRQFAAAVLGEFDPVALVGVIANLPYAPLLVVLAVAVPLVSPDRVRHQ